MNSKSEKVYELISLPRGIMLRIAFGIPLGEGVEELSSTLIL